MLRSFVVGVTIAGLALACAAAARAQTGPEIARSAEPRPIRPLESFPRRDERPIPRPPVPPTYASIELRRYPDIAEAGQGAAAAGDAFYAIVNTRIGKYAKSDGANLAERVGDPTQVVHINACAVIEARLMCAHSNFPHVPMLSSVEVFDPDTLTHLDSISLGEQIGSLTWIDRHDGTWWAAFANHDERGGQPGRDHHYAAVVRFDDEWRRMESYTFPASVLERFAPTATSGGQWGDDGLLYVTGHDAKEVYVLRLPEIGSNLVHVATVNVEFEGQGWAWDPTEERTIWSISRPNRAVVVTRIPPSPTRAEPGDEGTPLDSPRLPGDVG